MIYSIKLLNKLQQKFLAQGSSQGNLIINGTAENHTWIHLVIFCIAFIFLSTHSHPVFLQPRAFRCFYSLLCSLRQQLCPRSAIPAPQSGRLPQTTPHSGDEPSSDLGWAERKRAMVGHLCQALPSEYGTQFWQ